MACTVTRCCAAVVESGHVRQDLMLLRTQTPIGDKAYMKAMIPHHSSAILTSKHAQIKDPEVRKLADQIIQSQEREIAQMEKILERMD